MEESHSQRVGLGRRIWRGIDTTRRVVINLVFLAVAVGAVALLGSGGRAKVPASCALVIAPKGTIVEQLEGNPLDRLSREVMGAPAAETLLKDLVDAMAQARDDRRIKVVVLDLSGLASAGFTKLEDLKEALGKLRAAGKPVLATADMYNQYSYYLAAHADEVWLNPMGMVLLEGFSRYARFYRDGLDRLGVEWHVFRVGEYKSAVEPYLRSDMSPAAKEANLAYLNDLWGSYRRDVAAARNITPEKLQDLIDRYPEHLAAAGGDGAQVALAAGLVDRVAPRDELRRRIIELAGEDAKRHTFNQIAMRDYLKAVGKDRFGQKAKGDLIAVVVAKGAISDGTRPPGQIGGDSTAALIRQARHTKGVKAIVLRVDSPGGSGFASEVIRRELEVARADGTVVVASMGSVAASGGYWISMGADEVWASPNTITGSIGIFAMFPTIEKPLAKYLGVHVDGVGTTRLAGALRPDRGLDPAVAQAIQTMINDGYGDFLNVVAAARKMTPEAVDRVGRGRVWSGQRAFELGLVDHLGSLDDAIKAAASRAGLGEKYAVRFIESERSWKEKLLLGGLARVAALIGGEVATSRTAAPLLALARTVAVGDAELAALAAQHGILAYAHVPHE